MFLLSGNLIPAGGSRAYNALRLCGMFMFASEIAKQFALTFIAGGGQYNWWYFPFQLCSIPMYVLLFFPLKKCPGALVFLCCFGLLGGICAFADTSGMHYALPILTVHSYVWHIVLILVGLAAGALYFRDFGKKITRRTFLTSCGIYLACAVIAELLNLTLYQFGTINMFYISPRYRMSQIVFKQLVPVLGNNMTILLYILATMFGAFLLKLLWELLYTAFSHFHAENRAR